jgi:hypothetical protein
MLLKVSSMGWVALVILALFLFGYFTKDIKHIKKMVGMTISLKMMVLVLEV